MWSPAKIGFENVILMAIYLRVRPLHAKHDSGLQIRSWGNMQNLLWLRDEIAGAILWLSRQANTIGVWHQSGMLL